MMYVTTTTYTDFYNVRSNGSYDYNGSAVTGSKTEYMWVPNSAGYGNGNSVQQHRHAAGGHGPKPTPTAPSVHSKEIILDSSIIPCAKKIINELQEKDLHNSTVPDISKLKGTNHLSKTILDLFDNSKSYGIKFKIKQLGTSNEGNYYNGRTEYVKNFGWQITLDKDLVQRGTKLSIAKTTIHESMHAFIGYVLKTNRASDMSADLRTLYNKYKNEKKAQNLTEHQFISQYVEALAFSLSAWDHHRQSMEYYTNLSWGGLEATDAYKALKNKDEIQNIIKNERFNKKDAKGLKC